MIVALEIQPEVLKRVHPSEFVRLVNDKYREFKLHLDRLNESTDGSSISVKFIDSGFLRIEFSKEV